MQTEGRTNHMEGKLTSRELVQQLTAKHYTDAIEGKKRGELVAWASSIVPQEFCEAMGVHMIYPENHAAAVAAKKGAMPLLEHAEADHYSIDNCSYARINLAYITVQDCVYYNIPLPDFVIVCNNICHTIVKWYENLAYELNIPVIMIDTPYVYQKEISQNAIAYIKEQFNMTIKQLEQICKKPFDWDKFDKVMKISEKAALSWKRAMDFTKYDPSPMNGFNLFNYMALIVCMRGKQEAVELFDTIADECEQMIKDGTSQYKADQKFRVLWEGIACWPYLSQNYKKMSEYGMNIVASSYTELWMLLYEAGDLEGMARAYASILNNRDMDRQIEKRADLLEDFKCDGAIYHLNRSCKIMDGWQYQAQREAAKRTNTPFITFDGDQSDPRNFAEAQFDTRVQALSEMMAEKKGI